ncbi:adenylate/guanylate cyclase domain-containing protein [Frigoriflavimonas asaccharolytica]|uniref:Adenylate cyclase n=1 Tax=Frigoriflavimonas asaccharolytica TaxID=2735899 RepID=A0A8J8K6S9_9FLAO|nr:adenylate/guanylate cyclase domain-containing protein [Frigoriflavimonas asaccharolytica]NRS91278.1 class 3 adenylate cyclase [Frigoriflavimonas asaccharolytica]
MKCKFIATILVLFCYQIQAQNLQNSTIYTKKTADSLTKVATKLQDIGKSSETFPYFEKILKFYQQNNSNKEIGDTFTLISYSYYNLGEYKKAIEYNEKALIEFRKIKFNKGIAMGMNNNGGIYYYIGNYPKALDLYKKSLSISKNIGDEKMAASTMQNIGGIYARNKDYQSSLKYYDQAKKTFIKLNDHLSLAKLYLSTGYSYMQLDDDRSAESYFNNGINLAKKTGEKDVEMDVLLNQSELYFKNKDYQNALLKNKLSLTLANELNNLQYKTENTVAIGNIYNKLGFHKVAIEKCKEGLNLAEKLESNLSKKKACNCLYEAYKKTGNDKLALQFYEKTSVFQDSLKVEETTNSLMQMEFDNQNLKDSLNFAKKQNISRLKNNEVVSQKEKQRNIGLISLGLVFLIATALWSRLNFVRKSKNSLQIEKDRSDKLLLNILPEEIAEELKEKGSVVARDFELATILFTDFKSFTKTAETMTPQDLVEEINTCFKAFDIITEKHSIEKIKTIGDAYMAVGGVPIPDEASLLNIVLAGLEMQEFVKNRKQENELLNKPAFEMRVGIHAGPIIAGIVGIKKFQYDIWGNTVNIASRLESNGVVGKVNISEAIYNYLKDNPDLVFEYRGKIEVKGKGEINMYFVEKKI